MTDYYKSELLTHKEVSGFKETEIGLIPEDWDIKLAEKFCLKVADGTHDSPKKKDQGKYLITSRHLKGNELDFKNAYLISEQDFAEVNKRSKVDQWDVLISMIGTIGETYLEKNSEIDYAIKNIGLFKSKNKNCGKWLYYYLKSFPAKEYIHMNKSGTTQEYVTLGSLRKFPVAYPKDIIELKKIIHVLDSLDQKIELNNRTNQTLEEIGQAIFRHWFIHFEFPDDNGQPYKSGGGEMVDSELEKIPIGWGVGTLSNLCKLNANSWTPKTMPKKIYYVDLANTKDGIISDLQMFNSEDAPSRAKRILQSGDTIFGTVRPGNRSFTLIGEQKNQLTGSTGFAVLTPKEPALREIVYLITTSEENINRLTWLADGAAYPAVRPNVVTDEICFLPPKKVINSFHEIVGPLFDQILINKYENLYLSKIRDLLLPKLMSGKIRVR